VGQKVLSLERKSCLSNLSEAKRAVHVVVMVKKVKIAHFISLSLNIHLQTKIYSNSDSGNFVSQNIHT